MIRNLAIWLLIVGALAAGYGSLVFDWTLVIIGVVAGVLGVIVSVAAAFQTHAPKRRASRIH